MRVLRDGQLGVRDRGHGERTNREESRTEQAGGSQTRERGTLHGKTPDIANDARRLRERPGGVKKNRLSGVNHSGTVKWAATAWKNDTGSGSR